MLQHCGATIQLLHGISDRGWLFATYTRRVCPGGIRYTHVRNAEELLEAGKFSSFEHEAGAQRACSSAILSDGGMRSDSGLISSAGSTF